MNLRRAAERILITWDFARGLILLAIAVVVLVPVSLLLMTKFYPTSSTMFLWAIALPMCLAVLTTLGILTLSPYMTIATQLGRKRLHQRAGLAFIKSDTHKVLLARQPEHPWLNMWIMPGGYCNPSLGDKFLKDTAERRTRLALGSAPRLVARACLAKTNGSRAYRMAMIDIGAVPITDEVWFMTNEDDSPIKERSVPPSDDLHWFTAAEVRDSSVEIPVHMRELLQNLLGDSAGPVGLRFWTLQDDYENYLLQQVKGPEIDNVTT
jgi:ADP-ribose pyrophosphatase YjhB (NUDIX family)